MSGIMLMLIGGKGASAPVNTVAPALSDSTPQVGQVISVSNGTWTSDTTPTFTYQWQRSGSNIGGATSSSYTVVNSDYNNTLRCVVTATNPVGADSANSNTSSTVPGAQPVNTVAPALSDATPVEGQVLTVTNGTWTGVPTPTFTYQWQANGSNIGGQTSSSYTVTSGDVQSSLLRCVVTATNVINTVSATSNQSNYPDARTGSFVVVAGGAGGGYDAGGGGGAGGMIAGTPPGGGFSGSFTISVGGGGAGSTGGGVTGSDGSSSAGPFTSCAGGGGGGSFGNSAGRNGGSGGGGRRSDAGGTGTTGQGNAGGQASGSYGSGGGGGKVAAGGAGSAGSAAGEGGDGGLSSISGNQVKYAGGGGGGSDNPNPGGSGGGGGAGNGGSRGQGVPSTAASANSGGGGGGGANAGSAGGSGIVILRSNLPASGYSGTPTITTDGADTIYTFTGSGAISF